MTKQGMITRKRYASLQLLLGAAIAAVGVLLQSIHPKSIYDLPLYLIVIGVVIAVGALDMVLRKKKYEDTVDLSRRHIMHLIGDNALIIALVALVVLIAVVQPKFLQLRVMRDILTQMSPRLVVALGGGLAILIGGCDLTTGRMVGLSAVVSSSLLQSRDYANLFFPGLPELPLVVGIGVALLVCMLFGALCGALVAVFDVPAIIATLATQVIIYGSNSLYYGLNGSQPVGGLREDFAAIGQTRLFGEIPILIPIALGIMAIMWFILNYTEFGKNIYAVGGNRQAAVVSGINVRLTIFCLFLLASVLYGCAGIMEATRTAGATNVYGTNYEMDAIASCVVGGFSISGGGGKVSGVFIGVLIFNIISYGLNFIGLDPMWQQVIKGVIIATAVAMDMHKNVRK